MRNQGNGWTGGLAAVAQGAGTTGSRRSPVRKPVPGQSGESALPILTPIEQPKNGDPIIIDHKGDG